MRPVNQFKIVLARSHEWITISGLKRVVSQCINLLFKLRRERAL